MFKKIRRHIYNLTHPVIGEVWQLHRVRPNLTEDTNLRTYEITPTRLENLINTYITKGYEFVSMDSVYDYVMQSKKCKRQFVAITLDDGYEDNYSVAYPILKKYKIPFCIYVAQSYITGEKKASDNVDFKMLSIEQLKELSEEPLCTIGGHTHSHVRLNSLSKQDQKTEISECKKWLESILNEPVEHYAFPYGDYTTETLQIMQDVGIKCSVASWGGGVRITKRQFNIARVLVTEESIK